MKKTFLGLSVAASALFPLLASAQTFGTILNTIASLVNQLIPLALAVALLAFFWGLIMYIWKSGDGEAQERGKNVMVAGIVGLFVMICVWGLVGIIANTFNVQKGGSERPPSVTR